VTGQHLLKVLFFMFVSELRTHTPKCRSLSKCSIHTSIPTLDTSFKLRWLASKGGQ